MTHSLAFAVLVATHTFVIAHAASAHQHFQVQLQLVATCSIDSGNPDSLQQRPLTPRRNLDVACSRGTSYDIGVSEGIGVRTISSATGSTLHYTEERERNGKAAWKNLSLLGATGTGASASHNWNHHLPTTFTAILHGDTGLQRQVTLTLTF